MSSQATSSKAELRDTFISWATLESSAQSTVSSMLNGIFLTGLGLWYLFMSIKQLAGVVKNTLFDWDRKLITELNITSFVVGFWSRSKFPKLIGLISSSLLGEARFILFLVGVEWIESELVVEFGHISESSHNFISCFANRLFNVELKWFLIELSVLPGNSFAISAHLFPTLQCSLSMILSSSCVHFDRLMSGFRWLCHLSRHCLPILPVKEAAIILQFLAPFFLTISITIWSSSGVHGPLMSFGFRTFCHLCSHWTSVLFLKCEEIFFHDLAPCLTTSSFKSASSFLLQNCLTLLLLARLIPILKTINMECLFDIRGQVSNASLLISLIYGLLLGVG